MFVHHVSHKEPFNEIIQQQVLNQQKEVTFYAVNNYIVEWVATGCYGDQIINDFQKLLDKLIQEKILDSC